MQKIAIMGAHSTGKTTLTYILSAYFKMKQMNVKLIHESVRENCPFPINADANQGTCLWNFHTQFLNELEAEAQGYELAICDRSVLDTFVYFHAVNEMTPVTRSAVEQASQWLTTYDLLILLEPNDEVDLEDDGIRSTDRSYQKMIAEGFRKKLETYGKHVKDKMIYATSCDIFDDRLRDIFLERVGEKLIGQMVTI